MTINEATKRYRLPNPTTPEDLECRWSKVLTFGDKIVMAGHFYNGQNQPCYFGAAYEFLTDDHTCEGMIGLRAASRVEFEDDGTVTMETNADEVDITYDEVSAGLLIGEVRRQRQDLFEAMQMYYRIYILKENPADILTGEDE